ncbi:oligosaccharide flippase family protein [Janthinobacterium sp. GW460P]|uniref:oligosaccharide flippase family protein n=1 Tax=unclassified Janthinobacterium TaxID=2610881 RepID=UPI000A3297D4|nr:MULTISPECIES: oligosaccharide flippase family protein [unclassified Janthinobacterium]MCC7705155.1 oligosaccharide flippase family protein [Janthinobacterium sp. GW460P]MCC7710750.1 oligosaccharide flippase family protein [Janthinobacterium sp. GW460W]
MSATRHSFFFSFAEKYTVLLLGIIATMVLSRLLTPAEVGVYSLGAVLVALAQVVRDFGVGQYLIQEKQLDAVKLRAALATSLLVAWLLAALVLLASAPLAHFYDEPRLTLVLRLLSVNFLLIPFSALTLPMLRRQLRFRAIYAINAANSVVNLLVAVLLALQGCSYMSMVWAALAGSCASLLVSLLVRPRELPWLPARRGMGDIARFGAYATGGGLVDEAGVAAPDLIIGKLIGIESLALFGKAQSVLNIFNQAITSAISPVVFPLFAARAREGGGQGGAERVYLRTISYMTALAWPFFLFLACMALPLVKVLYGAQWIGCVPLIRIMCLSSAVYSMFSMARYLFVATGQLHAQVRLDAWAGAIKVALLLAAAPFGLVAVAWAVVLSNVLRSWLNYGCLRRLSALDWRILARALRKSLLLCGCSAVAPVASLLWLPVDTPALLALAGTALVTLLCWLAGLFLFKHELAGEFLLLQRKLASRWLAVKCTKG